MKPLTFISADEAVRGVRSGDHIHLSPIASVPHVLIDALCRRAGELRDLHFHHFHTEGPAPYGSKEYEGIFFDQGFFVGPNVRKSVQEGYADYIPTHLFESQAMYRSGALPCDVAMVQVSEPVDGIVSLGTSVDCSVAALEVARLKIAVVNPNVPFSYGEPIPVDRFDAFVLLRAVGGGAFGVEVVEVEVLEFTRPAAQGVDEDVRDAGDAGEVDVIPAPDAADGFVSRYECQGLHTQNRANISRFFVYL